MRWRPMRPDDLEAVHRLSQQVHVDYPEDLAVFAEKLALFPAGCRVLPQGGEIGGYLFSHPWRLGSVPPLNAPLGALPPRPDALHLHDIAILPEHRGQGHSHAALRLLRALADAGGLSWIALMAVGGTVALWSTFGFSPVAAEGAGTGSASYGAGALYMAARI